MQKGPNYQFLFETCVLTKDPRQLREVDFVCRVILLNDSRSLYEKVSEFVSVPWPLIAAIHFRESSQNFHCHLHNGDPLRARTVHVPSGRPEFGEPPFTWIESATDALSELNWYPPEWDIAGSLEFLERYNGLGYQKRGLYSPYLWNYTDKYISGLYVADGKFDPFKIEHRPGCVALLKMLEQKGVSLDFARTVPGSGSLH